ncbi:helix-turn-helix domain-containing protein [Pseudonocardia pini]|uniref:helix-turn-helix domain-containing protein n=1 Tax=Pseudonocardia pini TaxID=2758030 RepID=UPI0015F0CB4D|nr:helix-turn-helix transcriptional regulator [Pseudonocardia pini]
MENVNERVGSNVRTVRTTLQLTLAKVSAAMEALGVPMSLNTLSKIERGERGIDAAELLALAFVLATTPNRLLLSESARSSERIELAPGVRVPELVAWDWAEAVSAIGPWFGAAEYGRTMPPEEELIRINEGFRLISVPRRPNYDLPGVAPYLRSVMRLVQMLEDLAAEEGVRRTELLEMVRQIVSGIPDDPGDED